MKKRLDGSHLDIICLSFGFKTVLYKQKAIKNWQQPRSSPLSYFQTHVQSWWQQVVTVSRGRAVNGGQCVTLWGVCTEGASLFPVAGPLAGGAGTGVLRGVLGKESPARSDQPWATSMRGTHTSQPHREGEGLAWFTNERRPRAPSPEAIWVFREEAKLMLDGGRAVLKCLTSAVRLLAFHLTNNSSTYILEAVLSTWQTATHLIHRLWYGYYYWIY